MSESVIGNDVALRSSSPTRSSICGVMCESGMRREHTSGGQRTFGFEVCESGSSASITARVAFVYRPTAL